MTEQLIKTNGIELSVETFGDPDDAAVLLLAGSTASMLAWDAEFCERLAAGHRYVIRYDHRDTGKSVSYPPGEPGYGFDDLVGDAVGLIEALGVEPAHLVGSSMGGMIAQTIALDQLGLMSTLVLISSSPGAHASGESDLPGMSDEFREQYKDVRMPEDWSDRASVVQYCLDIQRPCVGGEFDEKRERALHEQVFDRATNIASSLINHFAMAQGTPWRGRLPELSVPALVIHGDSDPVHPLAHALALAKEIPGAELLTLPGTGHELPPKDWDTVVAAILKHTER